MSPTKSLPWTEEQIVDVARRFPTPFHLYDENTIRNQVRGLNRAFSWCKGFRNHFAVKATPNPFILKVLQEEGCGTDCSSLAELVLSEKMCFQGDEIMFTSNNTPLKEYKKAKSLGALVNLDDLSHVEFLHQSLGLPERISFRYNPGPERTGNAIIGCPKEAKFGTSLSQLLEGYKRCQELGVKSFGLHAMIVSNCQEVSELLETARMLFTLVGTINKSLGITIDMVNLGGGIGIPYRPEQKAMDVAAIGAGVKALHEELITGKGLPPLRIAMECGRYITGPGGALVSRCIHQKRTYKNYVGIDASMANLMRPGMYGAYHYISVIPDPNPPATAGASRDAALADNSADLLPTAVNVFDVVGGLCENNDKFAIDRPLTPVPRCGDVVVIHDAGAHGHSMGFQYNGKPRSAEYLFRPDGSVVQIRRAETLDDIFSTLDMPTAQAFGRSTAAQLTARLRSWCSGVGPLLIAGLEAVLLVGLATTYRRRALRSS